MLLPRICRLLGTRLPIPSSLLPFAPVRHSTGVNISPSMPDTPLKRKDQRDNVHAPKRIPGQYPSMKSPMTIDAGLKDHLAVVHRSIDVDPYRPEMLPPDLVTKASKTKEWTTPQFYFYLMFTMYAIFGLMGIPFFSYLAYLDMTRIPPSVEEPTQPMKYLYRPELAEVDDSLIWKVNEDL